MITTIPLAALLAGWALAGGSPGPATLAISGTAMGQGRRAGLTIASGIVAGSASWGIAAALGVAALMRNCDCVFSGVCDVRTRMPRWAS